MTMIRGVIAVLGLAVVAGCGDRQIILEGERLDVRTGTSLGAALDTTDVAADTGFAIPPQTAMASWTHTSGTPTHNIGNIAFTTAPQRVWSTNIGQGNNRKHRITSEPDHR